MIKTGIVSKDGKVFEVTWEMDSMVMKDTGELEDYKIRIISQTELYNKVDVDNQNMMEKIKELEDRVNELETKEVK